MWLVVSDIVGERCGTVDGKRTDDGQGQDAKEQTVSSLPCSTSVLDILRLPARHRPVPAHIVHHPMFSLHSQFTSFVFVLAMSNER